MLYLLILLGFIFFAGVAMTVNEGLWSNTISLACIIISSLVAVVWGSVLGGIVGALSGASESMWAFIFAGIWLVFAICNLLLRLIVDRVSRVRMRFIPQLDMIAGPLMGLCVSAMFTSFATFTLGVPFSAGIWDATKAPASQQQAYNYARTPYHNLAAKFYKSDFAELLAE